MEKRIVTNSRNEGNFIKRMNTKTREPYLKDWIARCNQKALIPFIRITKHDRFYRTVNYEIHTGDSVEKGVTHNSRRDSDQLMSLRKDQREQSIKQFIAACNPHLLVPFIEITAHDPNYRSIEYQIDTNPTTQSKRGES